MKKFCFLIMFIGVFNVLVHSNENIRFFWSFGDIGFSIDNLNSEFKVVPYVNIGNINWITKYGLGWRFNFFNIEWTDNIRQSYILPVEINYSPFGDRDAYLFLTVYGRGGWMVRFDPDESSLSERNHFFGAVGLRASWFPTMGSYWSIFTGAFIEYTTRNELRMGFSVDTGIVATLSTLILGIALSGSSD